MASARSSISRWARLLSHCQSTKPSPNLIQSFSTSVSPRKPYRVPNPHFLFCRHLYADAAGEVDDSRVVHQLLAEAERERQRAKEAKIKAGIEVDGEDEEDEDFLGVGPLIEKLEKKSAKDNENIDEFLEPTDSDTSDDERWAPEELERREAEFEKKCKVHEKMLQNFAKAETFNDAHKWMTKIDKYEQQHLKLSLEYRVIGDMMNRLKESAGKERFILLQKIKRAVRMMQIKETYDPNNPDNFGVIQHEHVASPDDIVDNTEKEKDMFQGAEIEEDEEEDREKKNDGKDVDEASESKGKNEIFSDKLNEVEKKIEVKLEELDHTFGKKRRVLEEDIRDLIEERNSLTEWKRRPLYRKGFDVRVLDVNRTCKVTKGGQLVKYSALLATGNFNGVVGFANAKGPNANIAFQRAYEKCFQNLHYVDRYEGHTIAHAIQTKYEKTKIYLWPGPMGSGMRAGQTVEAVLYLAGYSNVKSKIIGSRNPLNVVKALFKALNAVETPKDVQEKFGRTVVESYLL